MKKCNFWKVFAIIFGLFVFVCGIIEFINRKLSSKNINCDEYDANLKSMNDELMEDDFYVGNIDIDEDVEEGNEENEEVEE